MRTAAQFVRAAGEALKPLADAERAAGMAAYMRGQFTYLGIATPAHRAAISPLIREFRPESVAELRAAVDALWKKREREYQYVALGLLSRRNEVLTTDDMPWLLDLVQQKSWWDTVDALSKPVGAVVRRSGKAGQKQMDKAVLHGNFWVRRIAMIHQLGWRADTDTARLFDYARLLAPEKEFFIRKAIGWALRDYAWHNWQAIEAFLAAEGALFSGLTRREAAKNIAALRVRPIKNTP
jgi:3-methyladenine DNA glycosylase AlkD